MLVVHNLLAMPINGYGVLKPLISGGRVTIMKNPSCGGVCVYSNKFPCPCCGHRVFDHQPGFNQLCPICGWEDSLDQLRFPKMPGSANHVSLIEAQKNYVAHGASERRKRGTTRSPIEDEPRDESWRPVDVARDNIEEPQSGQRYGDSYPYEDTTVLYYWRPTYWRRVVG